MSFIQHKQVYKTMNLRFHQKANSMYYTSIYSSTHIAWALQLSLSLAVTSRAFSSESGGAHRGLNLCALHCSRSYKSTKIRYVAMKCTVINSNYLVYVVAAMKFLNTVQIFGTKDTIHYSIVDLKLKLGETNFTPFFLL